MQCLHSLPTLVELEAVQFISLAHSVWRTWVDIGRRMQCKTSHYTKHNFPIYETQNVMKLGCFPRSFGLKYILLMSHVLGVI